MSFSRRNEKWLVYDTSLMRPVAVTDSPQALSDTQIQYKFELDDNSDEKSVLMLLLSIADDVRIVGIGWGYFEERRLDLAIAVDGYEPRVAANKFMDQINSSHLDATADVLVHEFSHLERKYQWTALHVGKGVPA